MARYEICSERGKGDMFFDTRKYAKGFAFTLSNREIRLISAVKFKTYNTIANKILYLLVYYGCLDYI